KPTAHTSSEEVPVTAVNPEYSVSGRGTGTMLHAVPFQCSAMGMGPSVFGPTPSRYPTAHTSSEEIVATLWMYGRPSMDGTSVSLQEVPSQCSNSGASNPPSFRS